VSSAEPTNRAGQNHHFLGGVSVSALANARCPRRVANSLHLPALLYKHTYHRQRYSPQDMNRNAAATVRKIATHIPKACKLAVLQGAKNTGKAAARRPR